MVVATAPGRVLANVRNDSTLEENTASMYRARGLADAEGRSWKRSLLKALYETSPELEALGRTARGLLRDDPQPRCRSRGRNGSRPPHTPGWHRSHSGLNEIAMQSMLRSGFHGAMEWWRDRSTG